MEKTGVVYCFIDENKVPFYIGISVNFDSRKRKHRLETKKGNTLPKYNKMRKVVNGDWDKVYDHIVVLESGVPIEKLDQREIELIKNYRENGFKLYNLTDGGDGNLNPSDELRKKMSEVRIGQKRSEETKKRISESRKGMVFSEEHKKNLSIKRRKRIISEFTREKTSKTSKGKINIKFYELIDPNGEKHLTPNGLTLFCEQHGLSAANVHKVIRGQRKHHKGWTFSREVD